MSPSRSNATRRRFRRPERAGKTTIINLISRFYDPTSGAILIDGIDLRQVT